MVCSVRVGMAIEADAKVEVAPRAAGLLACVLA
jgi:hypothetical protein